MVHYPIDFHLLANEDYAFNCALWAKKVLREINIKLLDNKSIERLAEVLAHRDVGKYTWFHFKYVLSSLSLCFDSPKGYVKINSAKKLKELKK